MSELECNSSECFSCHVVGHACGEQELYRYKQLNTHSQQRDAQHLHIIMMMR